MTKQKANSRNLLGFLKQFLLILAVICLFFGVMLLENEKKSSPRPKAVRYWIQFSRNVEPEAVQRAYLAQKDSNSTRKETVPNGLHSTKGKSTQPKHTIPSSTSSPVYFDYQWTTQWGRQNKTAWRLVYGDMDCSDNSRRPSLTAILKKWTKIAKQHNIEYALFWGSLLGIVRNNDVIPWDHDMDLLVRYKDIQVLEKLGWPRDIHEWDGNTYINAIPSSEHTKPMADRHRWNCKGKAVHYHVDICSIQEPLVRLYNHGAFLDVFHFYDFGDSIVTIPEGHRAEISKSDFYPLRPCLFMGVQVWCPNNPKKVLTNWYGPDYFRPIKKCKKGRWL